MARPFFSPFVLSLSKDPMQANGKPCFDKLSTSGHWGVFHD